MSYTLDNGTTPEGVSVKTYPGEITDLGDALHLSFWGPRVPVVRFAPEDFLFTVFYILTNTDLAPGDSRPAFLEAVRAGKPFDGGRFPEGVRADVEGGAVTVRCAWSGDMELPFDAFLGVASRALGPVCRALGAGGDRFLAAVRAAHPGPGYSRGAQRLHMDFPRL